MVSISATRFKILDSNLGSAPQGGSVKSFIVIISRPQQSILTYMGNPTYMAAFHQDGRWEVLRRDWRRARIDGERWPYAERRMAIAIRHAIFISGAPLWPP